MAEVIVHNSMKHLVCGFHCILRKICFCFVARIFQVTLCLLTITPTPAHAHVIYLYNIVSGPKQSVQWSACTALPYVFLWFSHTCRFLLTHQLADVWKD